MSRFATCRRRSSYSFPACPESRKVSLNLRFGEKLLPRMVGDQLRARILKLSRDRDLVFDLDRDLLLEEDLIDLGGGDGDCDSAFLGIFLSLADRRSFFLITDLDACNRESCHKKNVW